MRFQIDEAVGILRSTPRVCAALLQDLPERWLNAHEAPDTFSPLDVLGHLIFGEQTDWIPRARIILECGESRPFDPFDRRGFGSLLEGRSVRDLLGLFSDLRTQNLAALEALEIGPDKLELAGTHPALGRVSMRNLLASWAVHDPGHTSQIVRVLAKQYREDVGPWVGFMSILNNPPA